MSFSITFFFHALRFLYIFFALFQDRIHLRPYGNDFIDRPSSALVFHLAQYFFACAARQRVVFRVVAGVVQAKIMAHVPVDVFRLDV